MLNRRSFLKRAEGWLQHALRQREAYRGHRRSGASRGLAMRLCIGAMLPAGNRLRKLFPGPNEIVEETLRQSGLPWRADQVWESGDGF